MPFEPSQFPAPKRQMSQRMQNLVATFDGNGTTQQFPSSLRGAAQTSQPTGDVDTQIYQGAFNEAEALGIAFAISKTNNASLQNSLKLEENKDAIQKILSSNSQISSITSSIQPQPQTEDELQTTKNLLIFCREKSAQLSELLATLQNARAPIAKIQEKSPELLYRAWADLAADFVSRPTAWNDDAFNFVPWALSQHLPYFKEHRLHIQHDSDQSTSYGGKEADQNNPSILPGDICLKLVNDHYSLVFDGKAFDIPANGDCFFHGITTGIDFNESKSRGEDTAYYFSLDWRENFSQDYFDSQKIVIDNMRRDIGNHIRGNPETYGPFLPDWALS